MRSAKTKQTKLHRQVLETIRRHRMLEPGDRVAVAVSGGADSVALLRLLEKLRGQLGIILLVVHFNHALRGAASDADELFVAGLARAAGLEFITAREDVAAQARRHRWNLEDAARRLRYRFFSSVVEAGKATRVAVAHTADDQAETVLARLVRGTGPTGLAGIHPVLGPVVRPLLEVRRQELREFLAARRQDWREDASNRDTRRLRSRLRHQLLPELERNFSPAIVARLNDLARLARDEEAFWSALVEDRFHARVTESSNGLSIYVPDLLVPLELSSPAAHPGPSAREPCRALAQRLVRRIFEGLRPRPGGQLTARHVAQVIRLAEQSTSGRRIQLPGGVVVARSFDRLDFSSEAEARPARGTSARAESSKTYEYPVEFPLRGLTTVSVPELGRRFCLKVIDWPGARSDTKRRFQGVEGSETLDADRLHAPLVLRNWRPGDAYRPVGRRRAQKLKEFFLDRRIAVQERSRWPVLTSGGSLVWVRGMPVAEGFAAGSGTRAGLVIAEEGL